MSVGAGYEREVNPQLDLKRWTTLELLQRSKYTSGNKSTRNKGVMTGMSRISCMREQVDLTQPNTG